MTKVRNLPTEGQTASVTGKQEPVKYYEKAVLDIKRSDE